MYITRFQVFTINSHFIPPSRKSAWASSFQKNPDFMQNSTLSCYSGLCLNLRWREPDLALSSKKTQIQTWTLFILHLVSINFNDDYQMMSVFDRKKFFDSTVFHFITVLWQMSPNLTSSIVSIISKEGRGCWTFEFWMCPFF